MSDFSLIVKLAADASQFDAGLKSAAAESRKFGQEAAAMFQATRTPAENYKKAVEKVSDAWRTGRIDGDTYSRALSKLRTEFDAVAKSAERVPTAMEKIKSAAGTLTGLGGIGLAVGASMAINHARQFAAESFEAYRTAQQAQLKLTAVLESTGHAAGFAKSQLNAYATALQATTNYDDDAIAGAQAVLATFKQIKGAQFTEAAKQILNISAVMGQDLKSSAVQLGKALENPLKGLSALQRIGVSFSADQAAVIKAFVRTGEVAKAQAEILKTIAGQGFEGAAQRMRNEVTGLANDWGDLQEAVGSFSDTAGANAAIKALSAGIREMTADVANLVEKFNALPGPGDVAEGLSTYLHLGTRFGLARFVVGDMFAPPKKEPEPFETPKSALPGGIGKPDTSSADAMKAASVEAAKNHLLLGESIDKVTAEFDRELATIGKSTSAIKLWELTQRGATEAELEELRAKQQGIELARQAAQLKEAERAAREALDKTVQSHIAALELESQLVGKSAAEQDRLKFALQGVSEARLADIAAAHKQLDAAKVHAEALKEFYEMVDRAPAEMATKAADEAAAQKKEFDAIAERNKSPGAKAAEKFAAEMEHLKGLQEKGLDPKLAAKEAAHIKQELNDAMTAARNGGKEAVNPTSENRALLRGTSEAFSAINRANDKKKQEKIAEDHLAVAKREEIVLRQIAESQRNVARWN